MDLTALTHNKQPAAGMVSLAGQQTEIEDLFFLGTDRHVHRLWRWSGCSGSHAYNGWHGQDVSAAAGSGTPLVGLDALTSFTGEVTLDAVFFVDGSSHLQELYLSTASPHQWNQLDVSAQIGQTVGSKSQLADLTFSVGTPADAETVFFLDGNDHIWGATYDPNSGFNWTGTDLTGSFNVASAASDTPLATNVNSAICNESPAGCGTSGLGVRKELYYLGPDKHVHLLGIAGLGSGATDLTAATGAPNVIP